MVNIGPFGHLNSWYLKLDDLTIDQGKLNCFSHLSQGQNFNFCNLYAQIGIFDTQSKIQYWHCLPQEDQTNNLDINGNEYMLLLEDSIDYLQIMRFWQGP